MLEQRKQTGIEEKPPKTIDQYAYMLTFSMRIGQGIRIPQHNALRYAKGRHPELEITDETFFPIMTTTKNLVYPMFFPSGVSRYSTAIAEHNSLHTNHSENGGMITKFKVDDGINDDLKKMQEIFYEDPEDPEVLLPEIVADILERDYHYLVDPGRGRPRKTTTEDDRSFFSDPWGSFFIEFVLRGRRTGTQEFNDMFHDVRTFIENQRTEQTEEWEKNIDPQVTKIVASHNSHHPDDQFTDSDLNKALLSSNQ